MKLGVWGVLIGFAAGAGCGDPVLSVDDDGNGSTTASASSTAGATLDPSEGTTDGPGSGTSTASAGATTSPTDPGTSSPAESSGSSGSDEIFDCNVFEQNCPDGQKCTFWARQSPSSWDATRCVPIVPDPAPVDEPCTVEGNGQTGFDSCDGTSMCWNINPDTDTGRCVAFCTGTPADPQCDDPGSLCSISGDGVLTICFPTCDPLDPDACPEGEVCGPSNNQSLICLPHASQGDGGPLAPCDFINTCDPGLACVDSGSIAACGGEATGCCTPFCDLDAPVCPGDTQCTTFFEEGEAPPGLEDLGICID